MAWVTMSNGYTYNIIAFYPPKFDEQDNIYKIHYAITNGQMSWFGNKNEKITKYYYDKLLEWLDNGAFGRFDINEVHKVYEERDRMGLNRE